jgi:protoporphyrinogen oxidase
MPDAEIARFAIAEIEKIGILRARDVLDSHVVRVPKTYPAYFGTYDRFDEVVKYMDRFENLFLVGRNGMHKYNNQDHSMLTAMTAVDNIIAGNLDKASLWQINTEQEYHEEKQAYVSSY